MKTTTDASKTVIFDDENVDKITATEDGAQHGSSAEPAASSSIGWNGADEKVGIPNSTSREGRDFNEGLLGRRNAWQDDAEDEDEDEEESEFWSVRALAQRTAKDVSSKEPCAFIVYGTHLLLEIPYDSAMDLVDEAFGRERSVRDQFCESQKLSRDETSKLAILDPESWYRVEWGNISIPAVKWLLRHVGDSEHLSGIVKNENIVLALSREEDGRRLLHELLKNEGFAELLDSTLGRINRLVGKPEEPEFRELIEAAAARRARIDAEVERMDRAVCLVIAAKGRDPFVVINEHATRHDVSERKLGCSDDCLNWVNPVVFGSEGMPELQPNGVVLPVPAHAVAWSLLLASPDELRFGTSDFAQTLEQRVRQAKSAEKKARVIRDGLLSLLASDPRIRVREKCAEFIKPSDEAFERLLRDPSENVRAMMLSKDDLPRQLPLWVIEHAIKEGSRREKLGVLKAFFRDSGMAIDIRKPLSDPDLVVRKAYAERAMAIIDASEEIYEAAGEIDIEEMWELGEEEYLEVYLDLTPPEPDFIEGDEFDEDKDEEEHEDDEARRESYEIYATAFELLRDGVSWVKPTK